MNGAKRIAVVLGIGLLFSATANQVNAFVIAPRITGARVTSLVPNGPGRWAGLEVGDVIVAIDGQAIRFVRDVPLLLAGKQRVLLIVRDGRTGQYTTAVAAPFNGRLGFRFQITLVPERSLPAMAGMSPRGR